jgi:hypothetical protein
LDNTKTKQELTEKIKSCKRTLKKPTMTDEEMYQLRAEQIVSVAEIGQIENSITTTTTTQKLSPELQKKLELIALEHQEASLKQREIVVSIIVISQCIDDPSQSWHGLSFLYANPRDIERIKVGKF